MLKVPHKKHESFIRETFCGLRLRNIIVFTEDNYSFPCNEMQNYKMDISLTLFCDFFLSHKPGGSNYKNLIR